MTASLSSTSTATTTITVSANPSSAVTLNGMTLTIAAGQTTSTGTVTITAVDNSTYTGNREVTVSGSAANDVGVTNPDDVTLTITEDEVKPVTVSFGAATYTVTEGSGVTVTVRLNAEPEREVEIPLDKMEQGGISTSDYGGVPISLTFGATSTEESFTFTAASDNVDDDGESVALSFGSLPSGVSAGGTATSTVSITDDDTPSVTASFQQPTYTVAEGGSATVSVTLSADPEQSVSIPLTATNYDGASGSDYSGVPASLTFNSGDTEKAFTFSAIQDTDNDDGESVKLGFGTLPTGVTAGSTSETTVSITDDDTPSVTVSFQQPTYTVTEGGSVTVTVTLSADPEQSVTIPLTTTNQGGATSSDYSGVPASLTFNSGESEKTFTFRGTQDTDNDDGESVKLGFGSMPTGAFAVNPTEATVSITDDDDPQVTVNWASATYTAPEGGSVQVKVTLSQAPERQVFVPITKTNQGGASNSDYSGVPASLTFGATDTEKTITFAAQDDSDDDDGESVKLTFGTLPHGVSAGNNDMATVSITDGDVPTVTVGFEESSYTVAEGSSTTITVELSADPEQSVTIPLTTTDQGETTSTDYSGVPASLTFNSGDTEKTFTFSATADDVDDDDEGVKIGFGDLLTGVNPGTKDETMVSITDDDYPANVSVSFEKASDTAPEGGSVVVKLTLSQEPERAVNIPFSKTNQGGASTDDYSGVPGSVSFAEDEAEKTFIFQATQDSVDDDGESVKVELGTLPTGISKGTNDNTVINITDDDVPTVNVEFQNNTYTVNEGSSVNITVTLSADPERTVRIPLTVTNQGGATDDDHSLVPEEVTFNSGQTSRIFTFQADEDTVDDDDESVKLRFGTLPPQVGAGSTSETTVSIIDDDVPAVTVSLEQASYSVSEGATTTVMVVLSRDPERTVTIPLTTTDQGGATSTDYSGVPSGMSFASGDTRKSFVFSATDDDVDDDGESVKIGFGTLPMGVSEGSTDETVVSIIDDDNPSISKVTLILTPSTINESGAGNVSTVSAILSATSTVTTTVTVSVAPSSAVTLSGTTLTIAAGQTTSTGSVTITAVDNSTYNGDREVTVSGSAVNSVGVTHPDDVTLTIAEDDDKPVSVSFGQSSYTVSEGSGVTVTVPIDTTELNGISASDYSGVPAGVTFGASDTQKSFTFTATDDSDDDAGESVEMSFGTLPSSVSAGPTTVATVTISDNDGPAGMPMVTLNVSHRVIEEQGGTRPSTATVTASLDKTSAAETTVTISTDPSAAEWFALSANKELTIPDGDSASTGMVTITALNGDDFGDYRVLTVEGTARNSEGANGPDPVTLTIMGKNADVIPYPENGTGPVMTFTSTDPENGQPGEGIEWDVTGVDADDFLIDARGVLMFRRPPDYEGPTDRARSTVDLNGDGDTDDTGEVATIGNDNMYQIAVRATEQMTSGPDHRALSAEAHVTVMVIDMNEPGTVTMNRLQPEVGTPITATLDDPDGDEDTDGAVGSDDDVVSLGWQWYVSKVEDPVAHVENHWTAATGNGNDTSTYTPAGDRVTEDTSTEVDEGRYLRAVVMYLDMGVEDTDDGVTVQMVRKEIAVTLNPVRKEVTSDLDGVGNTENGSPGFSLASSYTRTVAENSPVGTPIGDPVVAIDPNDDTLTYELDDDRDIDATDTSGDVGHFSIDIATGQIEVAKTLDYEDNADGYEFYVRATDPSGETAEVMVTVISTDANDAPVIMGSRAADATGLTPDAASELHVNEQDDDDGDAFNGGLDMLSLGKTGSGLGAKNVFTAMDEDARGQISWEIEGEDVDDFVLSSSGLSGPDEPIALMLRNPPDYEAPTDANRDNVYKVTLVARDSHGAVDSRPLTIFVDNVEEMGKATLSEEQPLIGQPTTVAVKDTDSSVAMATWQWMRATSTAAAWEVILGATTATYTPVKADGGHYLRAYATYIDSTSNADDPDTVTADERTQKLDGGATVAREATMMDGSETGSDRLYRVMVTSDYAVRVDTDTLVTDALPNLPCRPATGWSLRTPRSGPLSATPFKRLPSSTTRATRRPPSSTIWTPR